MIPLMTGPQMERGGGGLRSYTQGPACGGARAHTRTSPVLQRVPHLQLLSMSVGILSTLLQNLRTRSVPLTATRATLPCIDKRDEIGFTPPLDHFPAGHAPHLHSVV